MLQKGRVKLKKINSHVVSLTFQLRILALAGKNIHDRF